MNLEKASVYLAFLLRHCREPVWVDRNGGWAEVDTILTVLGGRFPGIDRKALEQIVATDKKGRYSFDDSATRIRANQGHSIPGVVVEMASPEPPEVLFHGTSDRFLANILREGLSPMSRQFVHLSADLSTAIAVGRRHGGRTVVLRVSAGKLKDAGYALLLSANGVWQTKAVPPEFLAVEYPVETGR